MNYRNVHIHPAVALFLSLLGAAFFAMGRAMFEAIGWMMFLTIPAGIVVAVSLIGLWFVPVRIVKEHPDTGPYKAFGWRESWAFIAVTVFLFLAGFFMVDFGDAEGSVKSVFTL